MQSSAKNGGLQGEDRGCLPVHRLGAKPVLDRPGPGHSEQRAAAPEAQNFIEVASDGNRRIPSDAELRDLFPNGPGYPRGPMPPAPKRLVMAPAMREANGFCSGIHVARGQVRFRKLRNEHDMQYTDMHTFFFSRFLTSESCPTSHKPLSAWL